MCGIAGFVTLDGHSQARETLRRMTDVIAHRGPDDAGHYFDGPAALGHRRLSIVDLAGGHQPMPNETESHWVIYNGEIFNHAAVRPELERAGHRYRNHSDTETLLHAYEEWGPKSLERYRGMFAFAIWDRERQTLFAARDRLGIKPFYYVWDGRKLVFASEIKALFEFPGISPEFRDEALEEYLAFGYLSGEDTMFRGVKRLMPGHWMRLDTRTGKLEIERYWDVPEAKPESGKSDADWIAECRARLEETVKMRLMSDVPLGSFLSGGADSSAITALMQRTMGRDLNTFSVGYAEEKYSELSFAAEVAKHLGTTHREVKVSRDDFFGVLPRMIWHEDEPIVWPSSVSLHFVSKLAAQHVKVVLTGEGADEMFGGYERYAWTRMNLEWGAAWGAMPGFVRGGVRSLIATSPLLSGDLRRKLGHTFLGRDRNVESLHLDNFYAAFGADQIARMRAGANRESIYASYRRYWDAREGSSLLSRMLYADQKTYLAELLMKQDQMSMSVSIESRVPFLDHTFVEFSTRVPDNLKIRGRVQKYIVKEAVKDLIPNDILFRKKMGFPTPLKAWLAAPEAREIVDPLTEAGSFIANYVDRGEVTRLVEAHRAGREDATDRLWRLLNLEIWGDLFFTGKRAERLDEYAAVS